MLFSGDARPKLTSSEKDYARKLKVKTPKLKKESPLKKRRLFQKKK